MNPPVGDGAQVGLLPDQMAGPLPSLTADGAYDRAGSCLGDRILDPFMRAARTALAVYWLGRLPPWL